VAFFDHGENLYPCTCGTDRTAPDGRKDHASIRAEGGRSACRIEYDHQGDRIFLTRTDVPKQLADCDAHRVLTEKTLSHVEAQKLKLIPLCPKVKDFLRQNPAWQRLLLKGVQLR